MRPKLTWLLAPISLAAFLATWGGWAKLASMTGYAKVEMLPGQGWSVFDIGIVLPMSVEPFGALAMAVAFNVGVRPWARTIAGIMAGTTLVAAAVCQAVVHHLTVTGATRAPDSVVTVASILPVIVIGLGAGLAMLNAARLPDAEVTQTSTRPSFLGRIGSALGDAAATQAERLAESSRASRDATQKLTQDATQTVPAERPGTTQEIVPTDPTPATQPVPGSTQRSVPAAQAALPAPKPDKDALMRQVAEMRLTTHPGTNRRWSYAQIGDELGISKSEAQRLGVDAEQKLPGTTELTQQIFGTTPETTEQKINGHDVLEGAGT